MKATYFFYFEINFEIQILKWVILKRLKQAFSSDIPPHIHFYMK